MSEDFAPTSPVLPTDSGIVRTQKQFSDALTTDLTDEEISQCMQLIVSIKKKYERKFVSKFNDPGSFTMEDAEKAIEEMADEMSYRLATEANVLASIDGSPILEGQPPEVEFIGALAGHSVSRYGMDHEKKEYEVKKATERGEAFLGERGTTDSAKAKRRDRNR